MSAFAQTATTTNNTTQKTYATNSVKTTSNSHQRSLTTAHTSKTPNKAGSKVIARSNEPKVSVPEVPQNLWVQIARDFKLPHQESRPEVQAQINWFVSHPKYLLRVASHAGYYMYYIHSQVVKRHLPGELVLLPMIESAYDPYAYSWVGAAGIWQMMPQTGLGFGLKQDWWYDARKSIIPSTKAALDYLFYLHSFFNGDWLLATAAYNYGEGNVQASVNRNASAGKATDFWSLQLPLETESYVPRLLALSAIVANPSKYGVTLPYIPNRPYFGVVELNQQLDLNRIAQMANISSTELYELNPGFTRFATDPDTRSQVLLPVSQIPLFEANLEDNRTGDISEHRPILLADNQQNAIGVDNTSNQTATVDYRHPTAQLVAGNSQPTQAPVYTQQPNQTALPTSFHASPTFNEAPPSKKVATAQTTKTTVMTNAKTVANFPKTYIVQPHQTMYAIAKSHGLTVAELEAMNHTTSSVLKAGDVLIVG